VTEEKAACVGAGGCAGISVDNCCKALFTLPVHQCVCCWIHHELVVSEEFYPNNREGDSGEQKCP
jgi:hypothetical protein